MKICIIMNGVILIKNEVENDYAIRVLNPRSDPGWDGTDPWAGRRWGTRCCTAGSRRSSARCPFVFRRSSAGDTTRAPSGSGPGPGTAGGPAPSHVAVLSSSSVAKHTQQYLLPKRKEIKLTQLQIKKKLNEHEKSLRTMPIICLDEVQV